MTINFYALKMVHSSKNKGKTIINYVEVLVEEKEEELIRKY
jgi:hypothetical protein